jgi:hypothetical protein
MALPARGEAREAHLPNARHLLDLSSAAPREASVL